MTGRERLQTVLAGGIPDCVPVAPDISNMVPCKLTGKPFWQLYLYNDPPVHEAYIAAARHYDIDSLMDGYFPLRFPEEQPEGPPQQPFIVKRTDERLLVQWSHEEAGRRVWQPFVDVHYIADASTWHLPIEKAGLPPEPDRPEPVEGIKPVDYGPTGLKRIKELMGDQGLVGVSATSSAALGDERDIYRYYDNPDKHEQWAAERVEKAEARMKRILALPEDQRPDFVCVGGSGTLVFQTVDIFRQLAFPAVKRAIELACEAGMPTHVHSCGPESALVKIMAEETDLTVIDPLEIRPMGDCDLAELKRLYGDKIVLKGNLHTTEVMLRGSVDDVIAASKKAIDDAAAGGGFILSTGDQCGRDTPEENLRAMVETARTYGRYE